MLVCRSKVGRLVDRWVVGLLIHPRKGGCVSWILIPPWKIWMICPSRVVRLCICIITQPGAGCINLLRCRICKLSDSRTSSHIVHGTRAKWTWVTWTWPVGINRSKTRRHYLVELPWHCIHLGCHVQWIVNFKNSFSFGGFWSGRSSTGWCMLDGILSQIFKESPRFIFTF